MKSPTLKKFPEPANYLCIFFINKNHVFAVTNPPDSWSRIQQDIERLERQLGATYSGRVITVEEYNNLVLDGINPAEGVIQSMTGGEHKDKILTIHTLTVLSLQM